MIKTSLTDWILTFNSVRSLFDCMLYKSEASWTRRSSFVLANSPTPRLRFRGSSAAVATRTPCQEIARRHLNILNFGVEFLMSELLESPFLVEQCLQRRNPWVFGRRRFHISSCSDGRTSQLFSGCTTFVQSSIVCILVRCLIFQAGNLPVCLILFILHPMQVVTYSCHLLQSANPRTISNSFLTAATHLYPFYYDVICRGQYIWEVEKMHAQYGTFLFSFLPVSPNVNG
jgi:hypothetical protein